MQNASPLKKTISPNKAVGLEAVWKGSLFGTISRACRVRCTRTSGE